MHAYRSIFANPERVEAFRAFVVQRGGVLRPPTNQWEVVRFLAGRETNVIYTNKRGAITICGVEAQAAAEAFALDPENVPEARGRKTTQPNQAARNRLRLRLIGRDGLECFYCGIEIAGERPTIEHLLARAHQGPNRLENMALAHQDCNAKAAHLSVVEKVKLRETMRAERSKA